MGGLGEARGDGAAAAGGGAPGPAGLRVKTLPGDHDDQQVMMVMMMMIVMVMSNRPKMISLTERLREPVELCNVARDSEALDKFTADPEGDMGLQVKIMMMIEMMMKIKIMIKSVR